MNVIAIDGPSASGKSTVARKVASKLEYLYMDSGALYRGVTREALQSGVNTEDEQGVLTLIERIDLEFSIENGALIFFINGRRLSGELREQAVNDNVSFVAAMAGVRRFMVDQLRSLTTYGDIVMEGRDIGTAVFPDARLKFYLDADPAERARRRHDEMLESGEQVEMGVILDSLASRDDRDRAREQDPLRCAEDAIVIDTTGMDIDQVVARILAQICE